jgi:hypothetical protein
VIVSAIALTWYIPGAEHFVPKHHAADGSRRRFPVPWLTLEYRVPGS